MVFLASNNGIGQQVGAPDAKLTPPGAVVPYVCVALATTKLPVSPNVYVGYMNQETMASIAPITLTNQAGVLHPLYMGAGGTTMGNPRMLTNCVPVTHQGNPTWGNWWNNPIGLIVLGGATTTIYGDAHARADVGATPTLGPHHKRILQDAVVGDRETLLAEQLEGAVGYIKLRRFSTDAPTRFFNALRQLDASAGMIVDLRGNPGGDNAAFEQIAGEVLPAGSVLAVREQDGERLEIVSRHEPTFFAPMVVLIDGATASAAELLVAALKHHRRATIMGQPSYGKGTAQRTCGTAHGSTYRTVAVFYTPDGSPIDGCGIAPEVVIDSDAVAETAIARALEVLRE